MWPPVSNGRQKVHHSPGIKTIYQIVVLNSDLWNPPGAKNSFTVHILVYTDIFTRIWYYKFKCIHVYLSNFFYIKKKWTAELCWNKIFLWINIDRIEGNCTWNKISTHSILGSFKLHVFLSFGDWIHEQNPPILVSIKIHTLIIRSLCICGYFMLNVLATNSSLWLNLTKLYIL